ncbi:MAG: hypothetical protein HYZ09_01175 [Candidatus Kerfeldbacteria bacterium]|nr:hypothetical protein [Candidatus Kerfeldbacteria bacterium]
MDEKVNDALLAFVDFLYAVVFGLIVAKLFDDILLEPILLTVKVKSSLLVLGTFYFLLWDWLHGRLLTLRNPFPSYRRFFIEIIIAGCGYGAAARALEGKVSFLFYIALILIVGSIWAVATMREYPRTEDRRQLAVIPRLQLVVMVIVIAFWLLWERLVGPEVGLPMTATLIAIGWVAVLIYELAIRRQAGIQAGPGVPFVSFQALEQFRAILKRFPLIRRSW